MSTTRIHARIHRLDRQCTTGLEGHAIAGVGREPQQLDTTLLRQWLPARITQTKRLPELRVPAREWPSSSHQSPPWNAYAAITVLAAQRTAGQPHRTRWESPAVSASPCRSERPSWISVARCCGVFSPGIRRSGEFAVVATDSCSVPPDRPKAGVALHDLEQAGARIAMWRSSNCAYRCRSAMHPGFARLRVLLTDCTKARNGHCRSRA